MLFRETNPIINKKINKIEKGLISDFKNQIKKTRDKNEQEQLQEFTKLYENLKSTNENEVEKVVAPAVIEEKVIKKAEPKAKDPVMFKTEPYKNRAL